MDKRDFNTLPPWEQLLKRVLWKQLGDLRQMEDGSFDVIFCHTDSAWQEKK